MGTIPTSLASCSSLQYLNLGENGLTGDFIEAIVSQMPALRKLVLSFNNFTGPFPASLANSSSLEVLDLSANVFTGKGVAFFKHLHEDLCTEYGLGSVLTIRGVRSLGLSKIPNFQRCNRTRFATRGSVNLFQTYWDGRGRIRTYVENLQQIYSLSPLTTRPLSPLTYSQVIFSIILVIE